MTVGDFLRRRRKQLKKSLAELGKNCEGYKNKSSASVMLSRCERNLVKVDEFNMEGLAKVYQMDSNMQSEFNMIVDRQSQSPITSTLITKSIDPIAQLLSDCSSLSQEDLSKLIDLLKAYEVVRKTDINST